MGRLIRLALQTIGALIVILAVALLAGFAFLPSWLQVDDRLESADYIVPLAGSLHRVLEAAELYQRGLAPKILLSNSVVREPSRIQRLSWVMGYPKIERHAFRTALLAHLGVPGEALEAFGAGHISTVEEAEALKAHIGDGPVRLIVVTSPAHTRRAKMILSDVLPRARIMMASPPEGRLSSRWWQDQISAQIMVAELSRLAYYLVGGRYRTSDGAP